MSWPQDSGTTSRQFTGTLNSSQVKVTTVASWQLDTFSIERTYCRSTAAEYRPCLGKATSSMTHAVGFSHCTNRFISRCRIASWSHGLWLTNCCSDCSDWYPGVTAAIRRMDLRPGQFSRPYR